MLRALFSFILSGIFFNKKVFSSGVRNTDIILEIVMFCPSSTGSQIIVIKQIRVVRTDDTSSW